jgi:hypothetical protein
LERQKKRYQEKRETILKQQKEYYEQNKEHINAYRTEWNINNPDKAKIISERARKKRRQDPIKYAHDLEKARQWRQKEKQTLMDAYGGKCVCCGEDRLEFLTIDHKHGGGCAHRKSLGKWGKGGHFYEWLKIHGYPQEDYQALCYNCNCARAQSIDGRCPHEIEKESEKDE